MTNDVMAIWCSEKNTHDSIVSDNTGNIYSQISTESFVRKYYQMKPLWTFSIKIIKSEHYLLNNVLISCISSTGTNHVHVNFMSASPDVP
jgi:hypothetical protein